MIGICEYCGAVIEDGTSFATIHNGSTRLMPELRLRVHLDCAVLREVNDVAGWHVKSMDDFANAVTALENDAYSVRRSRARAAERRADLAKARARR